jgi:hypothetical protein
MMLINHLFSATSGECLRKLDRLSSSFSISPINITNRVDSNELRQRHAPPPPINGEQTSTTPNNNNRLVQIWSLFVR